MKTNQANTYRSHPNECRCAVGCRKAKRRNGELFAGLPSEKTARAFLGCSEKDDGGVPGNTLTEGDLVWR
jgi:hypothetical protein